MQPQMQHVKTILLLLSLLLLTTGSALAVTVTIKLSPMVNRDTPKGKASDYFKRLVEQRSDHRIQVAITPEEDTAAAQPLEALRSNRIQMVVADIPDLYAFSSQLRLFELPFLFRDAEHLHRVIDGEVGARLIENVSQEGLVALSFWDDGFRQLTANRPLLRPEQLAGLRLHIPESAVFKRQLELFGAKPQTIPTGQLYAALETGEIDGQENSLIGIEEQRLHRVQSDLTLSNHRYRGSLVVTNQRFWTQLPDDLKVIIKGAIKDAAEYTREMAAQINSEALKKIEAAGVIKVHRLTPEVRDLWATKLQETYPEPYNRITEELLRKVRSEK